MNELTKDAMRGIGSGNAYNMSVIPSLMQTRRSAYAVYTKRMEEGKTIKEKDMQHNAKRRSRYIEHTEIIGLHEEVTFRSAQKHHK